MILNQIVEATRRRVEERKQRVPPSHLEELVSQAPPPRDFVAALKGADFALIAEIKRASPSAGWLNNHLEPRKLAQAYVRGGATALSVLTEPQFFQGSFTDLRAARAATPLPILCKDFILEPYQLQEARYHGADAVLLIATILPQEELEALIKQSRELGMTALVEVHREEEMVRAVEAGAELVGINNRNLEDFTVDLATSLRLRPLAPPGAIIVSESGIHSRQDILALKQAGIRAVLIGEALVRSPDPEAKIRQFLGHDQG